MQHLTAIEVFIYTLKKQMEKMDKKEGHVYLTMEACMELAVDIKKMTENKEINGQ